MGDEREAETWFYSNDSAGAGLWVADKDGRATKIASNVPLARVIQIVAAMNAATVQQEMF